MKHGNKTFSVLGITCLLLLFGCSKKEMPVLRVLDTENDKLIVITGDRTKPVHFHETEFVILGGGLGGIAAAISICSSGRTAILVDETDRIASCFTVQDTNYIADNSFIDSSGSSKSYQTFRAKIKEWYDNRSQSPPDMLSEHYPVLETFGSSGICFETGAALDVVNEMLEKKIERGNLTVLKRLKVAKVLTFNNRITSVIMVDLDDMSVHSIAGWMYVDATETGDLTPLLGLEYTVGSESRAETGEPHAPEIPDTSGDYDVYYCSDLSDITTDKDIHECYKVDLLREPSGRDMQKWQTVKRPRRIKGYTKLVEQDISAQFNDGPRARFFIDSVGIGFQPIHIGNNDGKPGSSIIETKPFQIPLSALITDGCVNLLAGGGNIRASSIASSAYGSPAAEWAVGEAAGEAAAYCAGNKINTTDFAGKLIHVKGLQKWLVKKRGVPIYWYDDVTPYDEDFVEAQLKPFDDPDYHDASTSLSYHDKK